MENAEFWIHHLDLKKHPEGGYFKETYRSDLQLSFPGFEGKRCQSTAIYFLLKAGEFSALHRIKSDEIWHFYCGSPLDIFTIDPLSGEGKVFKLGLNPMGNEHPQVTIPAGFWFGACVAGAEGYALVGCTVSPGFDFKDFEMPERSYFLNLYPMHKTWIDRLTHA